MGSTRSSSCNVQERREAQEKVRRFLAQHGFTGVGEKKRRMLKTTYPLHYAVKQKDAEMVRLLLRFGADPRQRDSRGRTAHEHAQALELSVDVHRAVLAAFERSQRSH